MGLTDRLLKCNSYSQLRSSGRAGVYCHFLSTLGIVLILIQQKEIAVDGIAGKNPETLLLKSVHIGEWCAGSQYAT